jgi:hypothetical protein
MSNVMSDAELGTALVMLGADTSQLEKDLRSGEQMVRGAATRMADSFKSLATKAQGIAQAWMALPMAIGASIFSLQQIGQEFGRVYELAKEGAQAFRIDEQFKNVAQSVGADADRMAERMSDAVSRTVEDSKLKSTAMKGMLYGLNQETMEGLAAASKTFARVSGQNVASTFESLTNSVTMMIPRQLMRLRLVTRTEMREIQKGITLGAIGPEEIAAEVMRKGQERQERMKIGPDISETFERFGTAWDELIERGGKLLATILQPILEILTVLMHVFTEVAEVITNILGPAFNMLATIARDVTDWFDKQVNSLKKLWDEVDRGEKSLTKLYNKSLLLGLGMSVKKFTEASPKYESMGMEYTGPIDSFKTELQIEEEATRESEKKKKDLKEQMRLVDIARNAEAAQLQMKTDISVAKQENAALLEITKSRHAAELKMWENQQQMKLTMQKRSETDRMQILEGGFKIEEQKASITLKNARNEANITRESAMAEMELDRKLEQEKQRYQLVQLGRKMMAVDPTKSKEAKEEHDRLRKEFDETQRHFDNLTRIKNEGQKKILDSKFGVEMKKANDAFDVSMSNLKKAQLEKRPVEATTMVADAITARLAERESQAKREGLAIDEKEAVLKRELERLAIDQVDFERSQLGIENERAGVLDKNKSTIEDQTALFKKQWEDLQASGDLKIKYINPFTDSVEDVLKMTTYLGKDDELTKKLKDLWNDLRKRMEDVTNEIGKQNIKTDDQLQKVKELRRTVALEVGIGAGSAYYDEKIRQTEATAGKMRKVGIDSTRWEYEEKRKLEVELNTWKLATATSLNEAMTAKAKLMLDETYNAYKMWAESTADAMQKTFSDVFFDAFEGKLKTLGDYLTAFTSSMNRAIADFLSKKFTGELIKFLFPEMSGEEKIQTIAQATVGDMNVATLNVANMPQLNQIANAAEQSWGGSGSGGDGGWRDAGASGNIVQSSGAAGAVKGAFEDVAQWFEDFGIFHEGGVVGATSDQKGFSGGLKENEQLAVLEKGEIVIPKGGLSDFIDRYAGARADGGPVDAFMKYLVGERGPEFFIPEETRPAEWNFFDDRWKSNLNRVGFEGDFEMSDDEKFYYTKSKQREALEYAANQPGEWEYEKAMRNYEDQYGEIGAGRNTKMQRMEREKWMQRWKAEREATGIPLDDYSQYLKTKHDLAHEKPRGSAPALFNWIKGLFTLGGEEIPGMAAGGPVEGGSLYGVGENGRELFAPQYAMPIVSSAIARAAEEAWAGKRVAKMEASDLAQYKEEYDTYRDYELKKEAWDREQAEKAKQKPEQGGLMSMLPTIASYALLGYGKDIAGMLGMGGPSTASWSWSALANNPSLIGSIPLPGAVDMGETEVAAQTERVASYMKEATPVHAAVPVTETTLPSGLQSLEAERDAYLAAKTVAASASAATAAESTLPSGLMSLEAERDAYLAANASGAPAEMGMGALSEYLGPAGAGFFAGSLSSGVKEIGNVATLGGWIGRGMSEEEQKQITKRYGGMAAGAAAGAAIGAMGGPVSFVTAPVGALIGGISGYFSQGGNLGTILPDVWEGVKGIGSGVWSAASDAWEGAKGIASSIGGGISDAFHSVTKFFGLAEGGPITAGALSLVGERGREIFIPKYHDGGIVGEIRMPEKESLFSVLHNWWNEKEKPSGDRTEQLMMIAPNLIPAESLVTKALLKAPKLIDYLMGFVGGEMVPGFARGGPVSARHLSLIGEEGPELFVPQVSGTIIPNNATEQILSQQMFSADGTGGFAPNAPIAMTGLADRAAIDYFSNMVVGGRMFGAGGSIGAGERGIVGDRGRELFVPGLPHYHSGGVVGGGRVPIASVPNQIVNVTNRVESAQNGAPQVINNQASISVQSLDGADAYRVLYANKDAIASILSEMRMDNNSRLRR